MLPVKLRACAYFNCIKAIRGRAAYGAPVIPHGANLIIDARQLPFWRRLPSILQACDMLACGEALELIVELEPWPLKDYLESTRPGEFDWLALADGPPVWRVRMSRRA